MALPRRGIAGRSRTGYHNWQRVFLIRDSQSEKESLLVQGGFLLFPFSFLAEGSFWERRMPLEVEILRNKKKKKPAHADTCPTQATIAASKDSASVQALLLGVAEGQS